MRNRLVTALVVGLVVVLAVLISSIAAFRIERTCTEFGRGAFDPPGTPQGETCDWKISRRF